MATRSGYALGPSWTRTPERSDIANQPSQASGSTMGLRCMNIQGFHTVLLALLAFSRSAPAPTGSAQEIPLYAREPITASQLKGRSLRELELMRSTILARATSVFVRCHVGPAFGWRRD